MCTIATLGPVGSDSFNAAQQFNADAEIITFKRTKSLIDYFKSDKADYLIVPVYNTRGGEIKEYLHLVEKMGCGSWIDNIVLPIHLSLGCLTECKEKTFDTIIGTESVFRQCNEYIDEKFSDTIRMAVPDIETAISFIKENKQNNYGIIASESYLKKHNLTLLVRELVPHNKTRFAIITKEKSKSTDYDATSFITKPLRDRVGMLSDILGEFTRRGINILDLQSENDIATQKLRIYIELEGHQDDQSIQDALYHLETNTIKEDKALTILGSFPRVDMRVKHIQSFGFIGSGAMSVWFADRLKNEGYKTIVTGRSSIVTPEKMIEEVDVVAVCVPISVTPDTIKRYGGLLKDGQALLILAGESERTISTALETTSEGVEVMFVHNLWGPQALTMKDKNVTIVRTHRSGKFSSEFEAFLYKHGAAIHYDSDLKHDLLMGVSQKLPTAISVALGMTLKEHGIDQNDITSHSTLTSIYGILAMARVHNQNPRTYAEIMSTKGEGKKIVTSFINNLEKISELATETKIEILAEIMDENKSEMSKDFLESRMKQAKAVDDILGDSSA